MKDLVKVDLTLLTGLAKVILKDSVTGIREELTYPFQPCKFY